ncbi:hypothetical protein [Mycolicibacterium brisbanense]|uniref:Mycothiol S-conjugate amidase n=1 Tax=Mycolicibacterium brisbanense TaxID=146020 RepID=A0A100VUH5_9MYCO|nr:hypothetical protein [Mycolicibacterium brisbanense]MCV7161422.1 hypothetical protein [Mycolicibacterium brisbanense]GAS86274.1 mycothiol S-conjugate amidase [Mycolicibacterium brisbanense]
MPSEQHVIDHVIATYGPIINLAERPETLIEIMRRYVLDDLDGGLPGGTPPPPPPDPCKVLEEVTLNEVMRQLLKLSRDVAALNKRLDAR